MKITQLYFPRFAILLGLSVALLLAQNTFAQCTPGIGPRTTPTPDFLLNGDGTVTHLRSGLLWKQCIEGQSGAGCATGTQSLLTWSDAHIAAKNSGFATYRDWRLPSYKERLVIEELTCGGQNTEIFGTGTPPDQEWTSSPGVSPQTGRTFRALRAFFLVLPGDFAATKTRQLPFRLVRSAGAVPRSTNVFDALLIAQTLSFPAQTIPSRRLQPAATFAINPLATGGLATAPPITYSASPTDVCTVSGTTITQVGLGQCVLTANKDGTDGISMAGPVSQIINLIATLDVDLSVTASRYDALTDALLVIRYLNNVTGNALVAGTLGSTASITNPVAIKAYLDAIRPLLDIDGNGVVDVATDGVLIQRYMLGFRGVPLVTGAVGISPPATRNTAAIEAYLQALMP